MEQDLRPWASQTPRPAVHDGIHVGKAGPAEATAGQGQGGVSSCGGLTRGTEVGKDGHPLSLETARSVTDVSLTVSERVKHRRAWLHGRTLDSCPYASSRVRPVTCPQPAWTRLLPSTIPGLHQVKPGGCRLMLGRMHHDVEGHPVLRSRVALRLSERGWGTLFTT